MQLAVESGHPERAVTSYVRMVVGHGKFKLLTASQQERVREQVAAGKSRDEVTAEMGFSMNTVATYARSLPGVQGRQFREVVGQVQKWPAPRVRVAAEVRSWTAAYAGVIRPGALELSGHPRWANSAISAG